ncbi:TetR/AcrR family transcriptional regulator [Herbidospora mongoliensis]|uniref:TetR/AcrR family transcriptional regulator n=1 Tax=Herbidospora mongoliensis TaxID=688067 RepID=UPI00083344C8|nr:TetR/AcrR family transcriptional regulator [Herbidospora mongoliensis]
MGRTSDARGRILTAATELFSLRSYGSIGVAEICARAGVPKGSFYHFFESKQALALEIIDLQWGSQRGYWQRVLDGEGSLVHRLKELFAFTVEVQNMSLNEAGVVCGCIFGNLSLELSTGDDPMRERLRAIFDEQVDLIRRSIEAAQALGDLPAIDARGAAKSIVAQIEGTVMFAKLFNDPGQLDELWANSLRLLQITEPQAI